MTDSAPSASVPSSDTATPSPLPKSISEIAAEVADAYEVSATPVAAAMVAILASTSGRVVRCVQPGGMVTPGFNLMVVTPSQSAPARDG